MYKLAGRMIVIRDQSPVHLKGLQKVRHSFLNNVEHYHSTEYLNR